MRLAVCALSAVLLSGCSWLGMGGHKTSSHSQSNGFYGANCHGAQGAHGGQYAGGAGCVGADGYGMAGNGYGAGAGYGAGYGASGGAGYGSNAGYGPAYNQTGFQGAYGGAGYGTNAGYGAAYGASQYGASQYNAGGATMIASNAPYGAAFGNSVVASQYGNGQVVAGGVQTVQGAPIYVRQPYPVPYAAGGIRGANAVSYGGAMPFGLELNGGTEFDIGGDIFTAKDPGLALGSTTVNTGGSEGISYDDAFGQMKSIGGTFGYDISRNTTLLGGVNYSTANGQVAEAYQSVDARTPGTFEDIDAEFSDLDLITIEGGVRQYVGYNPTFRPYVGATAGFTHNNGVDIQRTYTSDGVAYDAAPFEYVEAGWEPTAAATLGAEMAVGNRAAIGVETGIRWRNKMDTISESENRWSVPVSLRGRVSF